MGTDDHFQAFAGVGFIDFDGDQFTRVSIVSCRTHDTLVLMHQCVAGVCKETPVDIDAGIQHPPGSFIDRAGEDVCFFKLDPRYLIEVLSSKIVDMDVFFEDEGNPVDRFCIGIKILLYSRLKQGRFDGFISADKGIDLSFGIEVVSVNIGHDDACMSFDLRIAQQRGAFQMAREGLQRGFKCIRVCDWLNRADAHLVDGNLRGKPAGGIVLVIIKVVVIPDVRRKAFQACSGVSITEIVIAKSAFAKVFAEVEVIRDNDPVLCCKVDGEAEVDPLIGREVSDG